MGNDFEELFNSLLNCHRHRFVTELLDLGVADFVVALVGVRALALGDFTALDIVFDNFGNLVYLFFKFLVCNFT